MAENRNNTKNLTLNKPGLFSPTVVRGLRQGAAGQTVTFSTQENQLVDSSILSTSSFKYSVDGTGMRSTQQVNVDWSKFENHTFFNSAQVKTNVAFEKIFNEFPFDGQKSEFEGFFSALTGFEKYIYDLFPKNTGYMFFSGSTTTAGDPGTYITVKDIAGAAYPTVSTKNSGDTIINPGDKSMTIEFWAFVPAEQNSGSMIIDKHVDDGTISARQGFFVNLDPSTSTTTTTMSFGVVSGAIEDNFSVTMNKGEWNHVSWVWDRSPSVQQSFCYVNQELLASSSQPIEFGTISTETQDLLIGSGSSVTSLFTPTTTFSGALDELRIWHKVRSADEMNLTKEKSIFAQDGLQLYYKFNEPSGSNSSVILDYSTNSVHGRINASATTLFNVLNFPASQSMGSSPMIYEKLENSPILFPTHPDLITLRTELLLSASRYDNKNSNLITKLVPAHYFIEGQEQDALATETGKITEVLESGVDPRSISLGATQVFLLLLYTWAKFFDEIKLYIQALSTLNTVDYDFTDTVPDQFLLQYARNEGIELPPMFDGSSIEQFIEAENIQSDISTNDMSLQSVRNQIWRRILINLQDVLQSKGTIHSVKSFIRSVGIDPDNNFRIREYGGPNKLPLCFSRDNRNEISTLLDFVSGGLITSPYLTSIRTEPGFPSPGPDATNNSLLTSGSWTYEGLYKFPASNQTATSQSLVRFTVSGSGVSVDHGVVANVVSVKGGYTTLFVRNGSANPAVSVSPILSLAITGADLFDNDQWRVSFGRRRNDDGLASGISSSYFLRLAKQNFGEITDTYATSSYYNDLYSGVNDSVWTSVSPGAAASGSFITIGSQSLDTIAAALFLNGNDTGATEKTTDFTGRAGHFKFYSKYITEAEWAEHVRNYRSVGTTDPTKNFNFSTTPTGSFERLRLDVSTDQPVTNSNVSGEIILTDFSQNSFEFSGSGFLTSQQVIKPERFFFSYLSPKFDQASTTEKIRIRSFQNYENVQNTPWSELAPRYDIVGSEQPTDSTKFTIDYSVTDALDQDIITLFSSLEAYDNILGSPELMFSPDYPDLETLRDVYFNKLTGKMSLKVFFEFYKWFDTNLGSFISQLLPSKTKFLGTNFTVESHVLERPKVQYFSEDIYLGDNLRHSLRDTILLRIIEGTIGKY